MVITKNAHGPPREVTVRKKISLRTQCVMSLCRNLREQVGKFGSKCRSKAKLAGPGPGPVLGTYQPSDGQTNEIKGNRSISNLDRPP